MRSLSERIKAKAAELGFGKCGIARADALTEEGARLREWLNRGYHGTMEWMERNFERRVDPREIVPNAKSVICVAMNYFVDEQHADDLSVGKISRYAWGDDYHEIVGGRLKTLAAFIESQHPGVSTKSYVDTGPVMDKAWAVRAGIGWLGKHTNVITKEFGSWVFLGEVITDIALDYDEPIADFCGTCTACLDACPTGAITEPYVVDSNKCISYLTIEHKGEIAEELKPHFDGWIYGCDICQDVCPWNKFEKPTDVTGFRPRKENLASNLEELRQLSQDEFNKRFKKSPIKRTKLSGLTRNVEAVLRKPSPIASGSSANSDP